jgi:RHS repeat-associated protein
VRQKFTQQERDSETGLDYMHARYFASMQGRFTSADTVGGSIGNPQSLNRYAYVGNNPMNFSDPTGHDRFSASSNGFAEAMGEEGGGYMSPENPDYNPESILTDNMRNSLHSWNQRLQNTRDAIAANAAQANGDFSGAARIMDGNSSLEYDNNSSASVAVTADPLAVDFTRVELLSNDKEPEVLRTAEFVNNSVDLNVETTTGPDVEHGEVFTIRAHFQLPKGSKGCCSNGESFVKLSPENRFKLAGEGALFYEDRKVRTGSVDITLKRGDSEATSNKLAIHISGVYKSLEPYRGLGIIHLVMNREKPR